MSESPSIEFKARSYFPDTQEIKIVSPSPIHETIITWLQKCFITYSLQISHNDQIIAFGNDKSFVWWLIEVGFSQSDTFIIHKFGNIVKNNSDIKKLIKILINEDGTFQGPKEHTEVVNLVCKSGLWMNHEKFKSLVPPKTSDMMYGPVVIGGHNWLKLKAVRITVYLKDEVSGKF
ncbi:hypothetical protein BDR04DRAFT_1115943 [Suillus decipiens]|nr:hypothetical protein BDR04DRAFT_1115943 [Suillus decipiens]